MGRSGWSPCPLLPRAPLRLFQGEPVPGNVKHCKSPGARAPGIARRDDRAYRPHRPHVRGGATRRGGMPAGNSVTNRVSGDQAPRWCLGRSSRNCNRPDRVGSTPDMEDDGVDVAYQLSVNGDTQRNGHTRPMSIVELQCHASDFGQEGDEAVDSVYRESAAASTG